MAREIKRGTTSNIIRFILKDSRTGSGLTGLTNATTGLIISTICDNEATATIYTVAASNVETITTLGTYSAPTSSKCRFKEVNATNHKGLYEFQFADARFSVSSSKQLVISVTGATNLTDSDYEVEFVDNTAKDIYDIVAHASYGNAQLVRSTTPANTLTVDASNRASANLVAIDSNATSGNNATLNLKQLNVVNNAGTAAIFSSTGSNGDGMDITANGTGTGLLVSSGSTVTGTGMSIRSYNAGTALEIKNIAGSSSGTGIGVSIAGGTTSGDGLSISTTSGHGIKVTAAGASKDGINVTGVNGISATGTQAGILGVCGASGYGGIEGKAGSTGGAGIYAKAAAFTAYGIRAEGGQSLPGISALGGATNAPGIDTTGQGTGAGLKATGGTGGNGATISGAGTGAGVVITGGSSGGAGGAGLTVTGGTGSAAQSGGDSVVFTGGAAGVGGANGGIGLKLVGASGTSGGGNGMTIAGATGRVALTVTGDTAAGATITGYGGVNISSTGLGAGITVSSVNASYPAIHAANVGGGDAVKFEATTTGNGNGLHLVGYGNGNGLNVEGGTTGHGIQSQGGATGGDGMLVQGTAGAGLKALGGGGSADIYGTITGDLLGDVNYVLFDVQGNLSGTVGGRVNLKKNTAFSAFPFTMYNSTTHLPATGLTVTAERSINGAAFAACTNAVVEVGNGSYKIDLSAADMNGDSIKLKFTATGADQQDITVVTQA